MPLHVFGTSKSGMTEMPWNGRCNGSTFNTMVPALWSDDIMRTFDIVLCFVHVVCVGVSLALHGAGRDELPNHH